MLKLIEKIGLFRLLFLPLGLAIVIAAIINNIIGMGFVGVIVMIFGALNKCLLLGSCEVDSKKEEQKE